MPYARFVKSFQVGLPVRALPQLEHICDQQSYSSRASDRISSRKMLKRMGERRHSCLIPFAVFNHSPVLLFN